MSIELKRNTKAEQGVQGIQRWILARFKHRSFFSVDEINEAISELLDIYNNKIIKKIGKSRTTLFEEGEKLYLKELPTNRFIYKELKIATVNIDYLFPFSYFICIANGNFNFIIFSYFCIYKIFIFEK